VHETELAVQDHPGGAADDTGNRGAQADPAAQTRRVAASSASRCCSSESAQGAYPPAGLHPRAISPDHHAIGARAILQPSPTRSLVPPAGSDGAEFEDRVCLSSLA
jgi:hypothetical protein